MGAGVIGTRLCRLERALGVDAACPEGRCPFWEPGGAALDGRCVVEGIDFSRDREVAGWLLGVRRRLEETTPSGEDPGNEFRRALNDSLE
jgi:hypothetical protein